MKKNKMSFETRFWAGFATKNPFEVFDAIFDFAHLDYYKQNLSEIVLHCYNGKVYKKEYPERVFVFYAVLRSFLKVCFCLQYKGKKWKVRQLSDCKSILHRASLTKEEYANPFKVFQIAFAEKSLDEFDFFLCEVIHISLSANVVEFDHDLITPYIHLMKMLDASQIMRESGLEKIKKGKNPSE